MSGLNHFMKADSMVGYAKFRGLPYPEVGNFLGGALILLGGLGVLLGIYVEVSVAFLVVFLLVASFGIHHFWTDTDQQQKMGEKVNFLKNLALIGALLMMLAIETLWVLSL